MTAIPLIFDCDNCDKNIEFLKNDCDMRCDMKFFKTHFCDKDSEKINIAPTLQFSETTVGKKSSFSPSP